MKEEWKDVPGYEGSYQVSNLGEVRSLDRTIQFDGHASGIGGNTKKLKGRLLRATKLGKCGHLKVALGSGNTMLVHRLVLMAFVGPCQKGMECCHNDGDPKNNRLDNLRWDTRYENIQDTIRHGRWSCGKRRRGVESPISRLNQEQLDDAWKRLNNNESLRSIAKKFNVSHHTIARIRDGKSYN